jgi:hypothetical protein
MKGVVCLALRLAFRIRQIGPEERHTQNDALEPRPGPLSGESIQGAGAPFWPAVPDAVNSRWPASYKEISRQINDIKSTSLAPGKKLVEELEGDSEYREARIGLSEDAQKRQANLGG